MGKYTRKCADKYNRKAVVQLSLKGALIKEWETVGEVYRELGFDKSAILRCCKGKQKRSYWFMWRFKEDFEKEKGKQNGSDISEISGSV